MTLTHVTWSLQAIVGFFMVRVIEGVSNGIAFSFLAGMYIRLARRPDICMSRELLSWIALWTALAFGYFSVAASLYYHSAIRIARPELGISSGYVMLVVWAFAVIHMSTYPEQVLMYAAQSERKRKAAQVQE